MVNLTGEDHYVCWQQFNDTVQFNETKKTHYNLQLLLSIVGLLLILQIIVVCIIVGP